MTSVVVDPAVLDPVVPAEATTAMLSRAVTALFAVTAFVASGLIFVVEPLVARTMLPVLGGSASVWNSAMLTFQVLLLAGYVLAHLGATRLPRRWHPPAAVGLVVVTAAALPVGLREGWQPPASTPVLWVLVAVTVAVGGPFLALASVSPTLQRWYGAAAPGVDAYVLYAAGNVGSFVGLLAYPLILERVIGVDDQRAWWTAGYLVFAALFAVCAYIARRHATASADHAISPATPSHASRVSRKDLIRWALMAAGPSLLLLGVTRHLSTDVAAIPLLWVVPLSLYLLTFVVAFSGRGSRAVAISGRAATVLAAVAVVSLAAAMPAVPGLVLGLLSFTCLALAVHGRLASERPPVEDLTAFYLALSAGGAIGGVVGGLIAPVAFNGVAEYPLGIVACMVWVVPTAALGPRVRPLAATAVVGLLAVAGVLRVVIPDGDGPPRALQAVLGVAAVAALAASRRAGHYAGALAVAAAIAVAIPSAATVAQERTYYGVTRVLENQRGWHLLVSGTTVHGAQDPARPGVPLTYYAPGGPIADVVAHTNSGADRSFGVVGLGAGSMAAYGEAGDELTFYEIDPAVIDLATEPDVFSFISDSPAQVQIVEGDGRLSLSEAAGARHDLIVVDAFSSDAIPVHLMTREAIATYREALAADGVIAFHISNRYFDLAPVISRLAADAGMQVLTRGGIGEVDGSSPTVVVAIGTGGPAWDSLSQAPGWFPVAPGDSLWTDDHADVLGALHVT